MNSWRNRFIKVRSVSWLVVTAIVLLNLVPSHFHLHHADTGDISATSEVHVLDLHAATNADGETHHGESQQFQASPDGRINQLDDNPLPILLCLFLLALLPIIVFRGRLRPITHPLTIYKVYPHFAPPLRAPPHS